MAINDWTNAELTEVIQKRKPLETPIFDGYFKTRRNLRVAAASLDIVNGPEGLMVDVPTSASSPRYDTRRVVERITVTTPRFTEHDFVTGEEQTDYFLPGTKFGGEPFAQLLSDKLDGLRGRVDRTVEFGAATVLAYGEQRDGNGNALVRFPLPAVRTGIDLDADVDALEKIFSVAKRSVARALGIQSPKLTAWFGSTAWTQLKKNPRVLSLLDGPARNDLLMNGDLALIDGVAVNELMGVYEDDAGVQRTFIPDDYIVITSPDAGFRCYYGAVAGQGGTMIATNYYVQQETIRDPNATKIRVESRPLLIVTRPEAVVRFQVAV